MTENTTAANNTEAGLTTADGTPLPYSDAVEELETILAELDGSSVDVDHLADQVRRAADLVRYCRQRLDVVRVDVAAVVDDLDVDPDPADG